MTRDQVDVFEKLTAQLESLHAELSVLSKKSPNDAVNGFKLKFVNSALGQANSFFGERYRPFVSFEQFSSDDLPSNSDLTLILSQYLECAEKLRSDNLRNYRGLYYWWIDSEKDAPTMRAAPPKKLRV